MQQQHRHRQDNLATLQEAAGNGAGKRLLISGELWRRAWGGSWNFSEIICGLPMQGQKSEVSLQVPFSEFCWSCFEVRRIIIFEIIFEKPAKNKI